MNQYKEFCRLRDYRKPGAEVPQHTEAEAFGLATGRGQAQTFSARATGESKSQVAYKSHALQADEVRRHVAADLASPAGPVTTECEVRP